jgi:phenylpropionate dioxygenase-like ring-hydroxylating dioxygenase large terminal subunit
MDMTLRGDTAFTAEWARTLSDPQAFAHEQRCLRYTWTFLGFTGDVAKDGDWFRALLATRSVFVQRFGSELKGFENVCAHRFHPLRTKDKGNGPIVCDFHHWRYDKDGLAIGIPRCQENFGTVSRALGAHLAPIEIATCGTLIFGRVPAPEKREPLEDFLGPGFAILEFLSRPAHKSLAMSQALAANWKLGLQISFDDYHPVAVHPTTFGKSGYLERAKLTYARFGVHSAFITSDRPGVFEEMSAACANASFRPTCYSILQILPHFLLALFRTDGENYTCCIQHFAPLAHDRTLFRAWLYPAPIAVEGRWTARLWRQLGEPFRRPLVSYYARRVMREDNRICEGVQTVAHQIERPPYLAALEERIGWFEQSYRRLIAEGEMLIGKENAKQPSC